MRKMTLKKNTLLSLWYRRLSSNEHDSFGTNVVCVSVSNYKNDKTNRSNLIYGYDDVELATRMQMNHISDVDAADCCCRCKCTSRSLEGTGRGHQNTGWMVREIFAQEVCWVCLTLAAVWLFVLLIFTANARRKKVNSRLAVGFERCVAGNSN